MAYNALATQQGLSVSRVAGGEDSVEGSNVVITDEAIEGSRFVATKDGFAVEQLTVTEEGAAYAAVAGAVEEGDAQKPAE